MKRRRIQLAAGNGSLARDVLPHPTHLGRPFSRAELLMRFEYLPSVEKQPKLNEQTLAHIKSAPGFERWQAALSEPATTDKNIARTLLEKHLYD